MHVESRRRLDEAVAALQVAQCRGPQVHDDVTVGGEPPELVGHEPLRPLRVRVQQCHRVDVAVGDNPAGQALPGGPAGIAGLEMAAPEAGRARPRGTRRRSDSGPGYAVQDVLPVCRQWREPADPAQQSDVVTCVGEDQGSGSVQSGLCSPDADFARKRLYRYRR